MIQRIAHQVEPNARDVAPRSFRQSRGRRVSEMRCTEGKIGVSNHTCMHSSFYIICIMRIQFGVATSFKMPTWR